MLLYNAVQYSKQYVTGPTKIGYVGYTLSHNMTYLSTGIDLHSAIWIEFKSQSTTWNQLKFQSHTVKTYPLHRGVMYLPRVFWDTLRVHDFYSLVGSQGITGDIYKDSHVSNNNVNTAMEMQHNNII